MKWGIPRKCSKLPFTHYIEQIQEDSKILKMKINEKTLISFASSSAPCDREGWLLKRGEVKISISHLINSSLKNLLNSIFLKG